MSTKNIRASFLNYFKKNGHTVVPSDSLVPSSDPTLLFTSAGMVQFKAHFLQQIPLTFVRAASSQRCLRTTDIEQVGLTARHLTFFEMLGNFSFGDYFKTDAVAWAWEFLTKELQLSKDRLWISIYKDDDEAHAIWKKLVPESRIVRLGDDSNFWTMGPTGPCGPCSEIYWDLTGTGDAKGPDDSDRWMEIWNLVFTQYDRQPDGKLVPLPKKNIDTGMGLERLTSVVEGAPGNFSTSLLKPLIQFGEDTFKYKYGADSRKDVSLRIVADHLRAVTFLVYDGVLPSNEGRGYVVRRLLRRATRQASLFGKKDAFLHLGVPHVIDLMRETAPDLDQRRANIEDIIRQEEERFLGTIVTGSEKLQELIQEATRVGQKSVTGQEVFRLYDTFGFPPELTKEILAEQQLTFKQSEFDQAKAGAQDLAREGWKGSGAKDVSIYNELRKSIGPSKFVGYESLAAEAPVLAILKDGKPVQAAAPGDQVEIITNQTPFYPEGGGQVGDRGSIESPAKESVLAEVTDAQKPVTDVIAHRASLKQPLKVGDLVTFKVDPNHRNPTKRHHTATHLLHAALRKVLGTSVTQAGSLVAPDKLRFDYTYNKPPTTEQLQQVEDIVNNAVVSNLKVTPKITTPDDARKMGAMALFGEKYGSEVRCLLISAQGFEQFGDAFSLELCGGTHCSASGDIGAFKIVSDSSLAAGVRRIEAVAGLKALDYLRKFERTVLSISDRLRSTPDDVDTRVNKLLEKQKTLEQEVRELKLKLAQGGGSMDGQAPATQNVNGVNVAIKVSDGLDVKDLRTLADRLKQQIKSGLVLAASTTEEDGREKVSFIVTLTPDLKDKGIDAGRLAKKLAAELGGSGGGRSDFAQGGGQGKEKLRQALERIPELMK